MDLQKGDKLKELENAFPLPQPEPALCRDEYLKQLLEPYADESVESNIEEEEEESSDYTIKDVGLDTLLRASMSRKSQSSSISRRATGWGSIRRVTSLNINKIMEERYSHIVEAIGFIAVLYLLMDVKNQMQIVRDMWNVTANVEKSLAMFSWSIEDYFSRFRLRDHSYLDKVARELKGQMDCFKFRMDIKEIIRLVELIYDDFYRRRDICDNSMLAIRDAEMDIVELMMTMRKETDQQVMHLKKIMFDMPRSADPGGHRRMEISDKLTYMHFIAPIEARYRLNWAQAAQEQVMLKDELSIQELKDAITELDERSREYTNLRNLCELAFSMEISDYKRRIEETEMAYEKGIEQFDNEIQATRNKLAKAVEDLNFYQEQVPIFQEKIAQVMEIINKTEEANHMPEPDPELMTKRKSKKEMSKKKKF